MVVRGVYAISGLAFAACLSLAANAQLNTGRHQFWHQNSDNVADTSAQNDQFGKTLAAGDFDHDQFIDLAVGVPFEGLRSNNAIFAGGAVNIFYGSAAGLSTAIVASPRLSLDDADTGSAAAFDLFASALAAGDFNNDSFADLAIGIPNKTIDAVNSAGAVAVFFGGNEGVSTDNNQFISQNTLGIRDDAEFNDRFGNSLACGDFNNDRFSDLAIGINNESFPNAVDGGAVAILYGSDTGLSNRDDQLFKQGGDGIADSAEPADRYSSVLEVGDFNGDGFADLAVGIPDEDIGAVSDAGAVNIIYGSKDGLTSVNNQFFTQNFSEIAETAETGDRFGAALSSGDFNNDGFADLAIGATGESIGNIAHAGKVHIFYGSGNGLGTSGNQLFSQSELGIAGSSETNEQFGFALGSGDFNGDGFTDLAIGAPYESLNGLTNAGVFNVLYGSAAGLSITQSQFFSQAGLALDREGLESDDLFGSVFISADFDNDGYADLTIGVPDEDIGNSENAGAISVLYGAPKPEIFADNFD